MTAVAALAVVAAVAAPSAIAIPTSSWTTNHPLYVHAATPAHTTSGQPVNLPHVDHSVLRFQRVAAYRSGGFDWTAAGIGALAAVGACVILFGVTFDVRRRRHPTMA